MKLEQPRATRATKSPDPSIEPCHPIIRSTFNHQVSAHQTFLMQFPVRLTMKSGLLKEKDRMSLEEPIPKKGPGFSLGKTNYRQGNGASSTTRGANSKLSNPQT